ncbi:MAG: hypothetical protein HYY16_17865 [Planctomycetes bacterium]|nr:hypothetical protein [Planctomycetota bacterium]
MRGAPERMPEQVVGATRVGAYMVREGLFAQKGASDAQALALVGNLRDDLALRLAEGGVVWATRWADEEAASRFASVYGKMNPEARVIRKGDLVFVGVGPVSDPEEIFGRVVLIR